MISGHRKLALQDLANRGNDVSFEVNWNKTDKVQDCQFIKMRIGNGEEAIVSRDHLYTLMMLFLPTEQQADMIEPFAGRIPVDNYRTIVEVITNRDIKKGEPIVLPLTVSVNQRTGQMSIKP